MKNVISINFIIAIRPCYKQNNDYLKFFKNYDYFDYVIKKIEFENKIRLTSKGELRLPVYLKYIKEKALRPIEVTYDNVYKLMLEDNYFSILESKIGFMDSNRNNLLLLSIIMATGYLKKEQIEAIFSIMSYEGSLSLFELRERYEFIWEIENKVFSGSLWGDFAVYSRLHQQLKEELDIFFCILLFKLMQNYNKKSIFDIHTLRTFIHIEYNFLLNPQISKIFKLLMEFLIRYTKRHTIPIEDVKKVNDDYFINYLSKYKLTICTSSLKLIKYLVDETQDLNLLYTYNIELKENLYDLKIDKELCIAICEFIEFSIDISDKWLDITILKESLIIWNNLLRDKRIKQDDISNFICNERNIDRDTIDTIILDNSLNELEKHIIGVDKMQADVLIVISTQEEEEAIVNNDEWERCDDLDYTYYYLYENGLMFTLVRGIQYGKTDAAIMASYFVQKLEPRAIAMAGFAAGKKGKIQLGDIIVPYKLYDYDGGKQVRKNKYLKEIEGFRIDDQWKQLVERFGDDWRQSLKVQKPKTFDQQLYELLQEFNSGNATLKVKSIYNKTKYPDWEFVIKYMIKNELIKLCKDEQIEVDIKGRELINNYNILHPGGYKEDSPLTKVGVLATGSKVQEWSNIFDELEEYDRKTYALEMEATAIAKISSFSKLPFIVAKGIGDFAGEGKSFDNRFISYACHSSCRFLIEFFSSKQVKKYFITR